MSSYSSIQKSVIALYRAGAKRIVLDEINDRPAIAAKAGTAVVEDYPLGSAAGNVRLEVINVYSNLIITECGAFEMPAAWPSSGDYPPGTPIPSPLPPSLKNVGGTLSLDVNVAYYQQKRSHVSILQFGDQLVEDWLLVNMASPFSGYYQGMTSASSFAPALFLDAKPGLTGAALGRLNQLLAAGVTAS